MAHVTRSGARFRDGAGGSAEPGRRTCGKRGTDSGTAASDELFDEHLGLVALSAALDEERAALGQVRRSLEGRDHPGDAFRYPALVADWGSSYLEHERTIIENLLHRIDEGT